MDSDYYEGFNVHHSLARVPEHIKRLSTLTHLKNNSKFQQHLNDKDSILCIQFENYKNFLEKIASMSKYHNGYEKIWLFLAAIEETLQYLDVEPLMKSFTKLYKSCTLLLEHNFDTRYSQPPCNDNLNMKTKEMLTSSNINSISNASCGRQRKTKKEVEKSLQHPPKLIIQLTANERHILQLIYFLNKSMMSIMQKCIPMDESIDSKLQSNFNTELWLLRRKVLNNQLSSKISVLSIEKRIFESALLNNNRKITKNSTRLDISKCFSFYILCLQEIFRSVSCYTMDITDALYNHWGCMLSTIFKELNKTLSIRKNIFLKIKKLKAKKVEVSKRMNKVNKQLNDAGKVEIRLISELKIEKEESEILKQELIWHETCEILMSHTLSVLEKNSSKSLQWKNQSGSSHIELKAGTALLEPSMIRKIMYLCHLLKLSRSFVHLELRRNATSNDKRKMSATINQVGNIDSSTAMTSESIVESNDEFSSVSEVEMLVLAGVNNSLRVVEETVLIIKSMVSIEPKFKFIDTVVPPVALSNRKSRNTLCCFLTNKDFDLLPRCIKDIFLFVSKNFSYSLLQVNEVLQNMSEVYNAFQSVVYHNGGNYESYLNNEESFCEFTYNFFLIKFNSPILAETEVLKFFLSLQSLLSHNQPLISSIKYKYFDIGDFKRLTTYHKNLLDVSKPTQVEDSSGTYKWIALFGWMLGLTTTWNSEPNSEENISLNEKAVVDFVFFREQLCSSTIMQTELPHDNKQLFTTPYVWIYDKNASTWSMLEAGLKCLKEILKSSDKQTVDLYCQEAYDLSVVINFVPIYINNLTTAGGIPDGSTSRKSRAIHVETFLLFLMNIWRKKQLKALSHMKSILYGGQLSTKSMKQGIICGSYKIQVKKNEAIGEVENEIPEFFMPAGKTNSTKNAILESYCISYLETLSGIQASISNISDDFVSQIYTQSYLVATKDYLNKNGHISINTLVFLLCSCDQFRSRCEQTWKEIDKKYLGIVSPRNRSKSTSNTPFSSSHQMYFRKIQKLADKWKVEKVKFVKSIEQLVSDDELTYVQISCYSRLKKFENVLLSVSHALGIDLTQNKDCTINDKKMIDYVMIVSQEEIVNITWQSYRVLMVEVNKAINLSLSSKKYLQPDSIVTHNNNEIHGKERVTSVVLNPNRPNMKNMLKIAARLTAMKIGPSNRKDSSNPKGSNIIEKSGNGKSKSVLSRLKIDETREEFTTTVRYK